MSVKPVSRQTEISNMSVKTVSRHTETSNMSVKSITTEIYRNIEYNSVSSQTGKAIPSTNIPKPKVHNTKTLIIGSSILKGIKTRELTNTGACTNRGEDINTLINIIERRDSSVYNTITIHIGDNDLSDGYSLDSIYENYQSLLYLLRAKANMEAV